MKTTQERLGRIEVTQYFILAAIAGHIGYPIVIYIIAILL